MTLQQLLEQIRAFYLKTFADAVREAKNGARAVHVEPLHRGAKGKLVLDEVLGLPERRDIVIEEAEGIHSRIVDSQSQLGFHPVVVPWHEDLRVVFEPFCWDSLFVEVALSEDAMLTALTAWANEWLDPSDRQVRDKQGFAGAIHYVGEPFQNKKHWLLPLDLGTAPTQALVKLVDALAEAGATALRVAGAPEAAIDAAKKPAAKKAVAKAPAAKKLVAKKAVAKPASKAPAKKAPAAKKAVAKPASKAPAKKAPAAKKAVAKPASKAPVAKKLVAKKAVAKPAAKAPAKKAPVAKKAVAKARAAKPPVAKKAAKRA